MAFGKAFQRYIGEVIHAADTHASFSILPETPYFVGKHRRDTVDWLVEDHTGVLFIEAKTKRLRFDAKADLSSAKPLACISDAELANVERTSVQLARDGHWN